MSDWSHDLPFGLPPNFDYGLVRTTDDASYMIGALPNADRGTAAVELYEAREVVGDAVAYEGMMTAWDHDHGHVLAAFGDDQFFADALSEVAPPLKLSNPVRLWRGVGITEVVDPAYAASGVSWTRSRDMACWFAFRFERPRPFVFRVDLDPCCVIAVHHHRREREVLVNPEALGWGPVVLDGSQIKLEMLEPDANAPDHLIERWRRRCEQVRERRRIRDAKRLEHYTRRIHAGGSVPTRQEAPG
jgi:hypothetical protein